LTGEKSSDACLRANDQEMTDTKPSFFSRISSFSFFSNNNLNKRETAEPCTEFNEPQKEMPKSWSFTSLLRRKPVKSTVTLETNEALVIPLFPHGDVVWNAGERVSIQWAKRANIVLDSASEHYEACEATSESRQGACEATSESHKIEATSESHKSEATSESQKAKETNESQNAKETNESQKETIDEASEMPLDKNDLQLTIQLCRDVVYFPNGAIETTIAQHLSFSQPGLLEWTVPETVRSSHKYFIKFIATHPVPNVVQNQVLTSATETGVPEAKIAFVVQSDFFQIVGDAANDSIQELERVANGIASVTFAVEYRHPEMPSSAPEAQEYLVKH